MSCVYCRPPNFATHRDRSELTADEVELLVRHLAANHELRKVRLTGGEPTTRPDLLQIIEQLATIPQLQDLALTTNGLTLSRQAFSLRSAGLRRVNVSLDSLLSDVFARMSGVDGLIRVLEGIDAAKEVGLSPRINTVVVRGQNEQDLPDLVSYAADRDVEIRFIEFMPMGPLHQTWSQRFVEESEMRQILSRAVRSWEPMPCDSASARRSIATLTDGRQVRVGFITAMSHPFCDACDRIRIGCKGEFYPCLMDKPAANLMSSIRPRFNAEQFDQTLRLGLQSKAPAHPSQGHAVMITIGG